ncbi:MAG TPA: YciI family protein [Acidimicrobiia bacterium]|nr:YciI family protein [Acidimicrobiia bacterium]
MKYILLIYQNPAAWENLSEEERNRVFGEVDSLMAELTRSGEWIGGEGLADASQTKTVRVRDGVPAVTDGPFIESKEQLAGYCIVECETPERATEIAARWPDARYWAMEVRAIMEPAGEEM